MNKQKFIDWCIEAHRDTNHQYSKILPYEFHLQLVHNAAIQFQHVWKKVGEFDFEIIECGCYGHDLITDCRQTYHNILYAADGLGIGIPVIIAEMIRAVSEDVRGRNREERMPPHIYEEIRNTPGAMFLKLADRLGNVKFGVLMGKTGMYLKYQKEQEHFKDELYHEDYKEIWDHLDELLKK